MAETAFFHEAARRAVREAIEDIERRTSAEVVVAVHKTSGEYADVDYLAGFTVAFGTLLLLLFHPEEFEIVGMPLQVLVAFVVGSLATRVLWPVRRLLVPRERRKAAVRRAARAAFVEGGISRTRGRTGILVYVSMFERAAFVVPDIGVDVKVLGPGWDAGLEALERALATGANLAAFVEALKSLGPPLGEALPRAEDDVNELADEPVMA